MPPVGNYTVQNLREVEDSAPRFGYAPQLEARFASPALGTERSGLSYQRLSPGFRVPFGHTHGEQEEVYVIVSGSARAKVGEDIVELGQWDALRVPGEVMRAFEGGPNGCELLAFGAPSSGAAPSSDVKMVPDWWTG